MQPLILALFAAVFSLDYLALSHGVSSEVTLLAELLSLCAAIAFVGYSARTQSITLSLKYLIFFVVLGLHLVNGVIINATSPGAIVSGIRVYFKYAPFFLLPLVYCFSTRQVAGQLRFLLFLCLMQLPVAIYQRFFLYRSFMAGTGDVVRGTLPTSSFLSIVLICAIALVIAFYLKRLISLRMFLGLLLVLFIPTAINETKGTLILLPIALFAPLLFSSGGKSKRKQAMAFVAVAGVLFGGYVTVYNALYTQRSATEEEGIVSFFTDPQKIIRYLAPRTSGMVTREDDATVGRLDRIAMALNYLSRDPVKLLVGLGIGSVSKSPIEALSPDIEALSADISKWSGDPVGWESELQSGTGIAQIVWETGVLGLLLLYVFLYLVFRDARALSARDDNDGAIGLAWCAVVPIIALSYFYKDILPVNGIMYPFWYLTGYVVAQRFRHTAQAKPFPRRESIRRRTQWSPDTPQTTPTFRDLAPRLRDPQP